MNLFLVPRLRIRKALSPFLHLPSYSGTILGTGTLPVNLLLFLAMPQTRTDTPRAMVCILQLADTSSELPSQTQAALFEWTVEILQYFYHLLLPAPSLLPLVGIASQCVSVLKVLMQYTN